MEGFLGQESRGSWWHNKKNTRKGKNVSGKRILLFLLKCDEGTKEVTLTRVSVLVQLYPKRLWSWDMILMREIGVEGRKAFQEEERITMENRWDTSGKCTQPTLGWSAGYPRRRSRKGCNRQVDCIKVNNKELRNLNTQSLKQDYLISALTPSWSEGLCLKKIRI